MFGCIVAGRPVQTNLQTVSPTHFIFTLPQPASINHLVVFLLPDAVLPPTHAATVHIRFPTAAAGEFRLLGAISAAKPSAVFRVGGAAAAAADGDATLGIAIDELPNVEAALASLPPPPPAAAAPESSALVKAQRGLGTLVLARRIIGNAFNYLGSFAVPVGPAGEEMVPLKAFRDWWAKFEKKVEYDPTFLEREDGGGA
ncbi:hypothetical protein FN846DRAFT_922173 [Sphaerosporella brunnea]|uniref:Uncharacterized protein n=1 Tax=Sphaerosporella brunnea TaxID=1250544 RepID=A0A5J5EKV8_9PEZI|nr:hypothetical protein FN846DRAFT_922173 [Sphaerosporella brunnea]